MNCQYCNRKLRGSNYKCKYCLPKIVYIEDLNNQIGIQITINNQSYSGYLPKDNLKEVL